MTGYQKARWFRTYRQRIVDRLERCRNCKRPDDPRNWLTFDHIVPKSAGASLPFSNATILCEDCQDDKADGLWPHLVSLHEEEAAAPRERRWALLARIAAFRGSDPRQPAQRDLDGCAVTLYQHSVLGMLCVRCPLRDPVDVVFRDDLAGLSEHLHLHRSAGQHVPDWVFADLPNAMTVDPCPTGGS